MKNQTEVVGRHRDAFDQMQIVRSAGRRDRLEIADAPGGIPRAQAVVERGVARRGVGAILPKRTVEVEDTPLRERRFRASHQPDGRVPGGDMDHVDRDNRVHPCHRPRLTGRVDRQWQSDVRQPGGAGVGDDTATGRLIRIAGHPDACGERTSEVSGVLARPARDLEDKAAGRENALEDLDDRGGVAGRGRRKQGIGHGALLRGAGADRMPFRGGTPARRQRHDFSSKRAAAARADRGVMLMASKTEFHHAFSQRHHPPTVEPRPPHRPQAAV
ncbi:protein of unknown function [Methylorubrum extorquens]|uniref:Uncharacterized protein n=1 Tax=Methylorubrum extorquens TaxID=408 RepID=A0A2N9AWB1_METEX|nr:protein of unknown function [Methylorubrum extorquens]